MNATVLSNLLVDNLDKNVLFLDDGRVIIKKMAYYPSYLSTPTGKTKMTGYTMFFGGSIPFRDPAIPGMHYMQMLGNAWLSLSATNKQRFNRIAQYCNKNTQEEAEVDRKEYYKEMFKSNTQFIKLLLSLPSLLILKIADYKTDYKTDHVIRLPDAVVGYHEKIKMVEEMKD